MTSFSTPRERAVALAYRRLIDRIADDRFAQGVSVRALGAQTGTSIATITGIENGSWWPRWGTLGRVAGGVGLTLAVRAKDDLTGPWEPDVLALVHQKIASTRRLSFAAVAVEIGVQARTLSRLQDTASPSAATVLAVCDRLGLEVRARASIRPPN